MRAGLFRLACAAAALTALAACSGGSDGSTALPSAPPSATSPATTPPATTSSSAPTTSSPATAGTKRSPIFWTGKTIDDPTKSEVVTAAQAYWSMFARVLETPNPADAELQQRTLDPQRSRLIQLLGGYVQRNQSERGPIFGSIDEVSVTASKAEVTTCLNLSRSQKYIGGRLRPASHGGEHDFYILTLQRVGADWKVVNQSSPSGKSCTVAKS